jgi:TPR repeat protein
LAEAHGVVENREEALKYLKLAALQNENEIALYALGFEFKTENNLKESFIYHFHNAKKFGNAKSM